MLVCHCRVVGDRAIRATVAAGARDLDAVMESCGVGDACGGCLPAVERLLEEAALAVREPVLVGARQAARRASGTRLAPAAFALSPSTAA